MDGAVYATPGYGFLCMPRDITERLAEQGYKFDVADAWLDLWCLRDYGFCCGLAQCLAALWRNCCLRHLKERLYFLIIK